MKQRSLKKTPIFVTRFNKLKETLKKARSFVNLGIVCQIREFNTMNIFGNKKGNPKNFGFPRSMSYMIRTRVNQRRSDLTWII